ncbi:unnamed protein product [Rhizophagus irregularis]|nr:unnamed protein product [Rhizophagus irregularis]
MSVPKVIVLFKSYFRSFHSLCKFGRIRNDVKKSAIVTGKGLEDNTIVSDDRIIHKPYHPLNICHFSKWCCLGKAPSSSL